MEAIRNKTYYALILWENGAHCGTSHPDEYDTPEEAEKAAMLLLKSGKFTAVDIRKEEIYYRAENVEISASGLYETLYRDVECAEKWETYRHGLFPNHAVKFPVRYIMDEEEILIDKYPNGKYYIHYGWMENQQSGVCVAGGFDTFADAEKTLVRHRPLVIKTT